ncbi:MAG: hypothetical protein MJ236_07615 [Clostridia bacterium]|nr:hypothetical protein [Clostridia bacterium]
MDKDIILTVLKQDLEISGTSRDAMLENIIDLAMAAITREGITLNNSVDDGMLVENYAAFLYRKRREEAVAMPRSLRYLLNNRLLAEKGRE